MNPKLKVISLQVPEKIVIIFHSFLQKNKIHGKISFP
jgi:hypothetical protein